MATAHGAMLVNLGRQRRVVEERIASGAYESADEVIQAALRALDREESETNQWLMQLAEESLADPRPSIAADEVFRSLRAKYGRPAVEPVR